MANQPEAGNQKAGAVSGIDQGQKTQKEHLSRQQPRPGRDDRLDDDLERERLEPGLNSEGTGGAGGNPAGTREGGNSNT